VTVGCVAIAGYRSLHDLCFAPGPLTVISGGNGVGKSNVYRALELMHAAAHGRLARSLALEGGVPSAAWAGPEEVRTDAAKRRGQPIQPTIRRKPLRIRLGMQLDAGCFEMTIGLPAPEEPPPPPLLPTAFSMDPLVKEEWLWSAPPRRKNKPFLTRDGGAAIGVDSDGRTRTYAPLDASESVLGQLDEPQLLSDLWHLQRTLRSFRFYLHPDLLVPLAEALALASRRSSVWVVSHAHALVGALEARAKVTHVELVRDEDGATRIAGQRLIDRPVWP
jgi:predicted ATPase